MAEQPGKQGGSAGGYCARQKSTDYHPPGANIFVSTYLNRIHSDLLQEIPLLHLETELQ